MTRAKGLDWMPLDIAALYDSERVALLSPAAEALYIRLLCRCFQHGSLPVSPAAVRQLVPKFSEGWDALWEEVRPLFEELDGRLVNARATEERERAMRVLTARREAGKAGGRPKKPFAFQTESKSKPPPNHSEPQDRDIDKTETVESKPPCIPPAGGAPAEPPTKRRARRPDPGWESVLARPAYATLRASPVFEAAWAAWIEHTRTSGTKAREPSSTSAAAILNTAAREGPERFARAVELTIASNWQGIHYPDARSGAPAASRHATKTDAGIALVFEQAGIQFPGFTDDQR